MLCLLILLEYTIASLLEPWFSVVQDPGRLNNQQPPRPKVCPVTEFLEDVGKGGTELAIEAGLVTCKLPVVQAPNANLEDLTME
jgi:hypothetical protein